MSTVQKLEEAYKLARSAAAGYSNYCDETPNTRNLEKTLDKAEALYNEYLLSASNPQAKYPQY